MPMVYNGTHQRVCTVFFVYKCDLLDLSFLGRSPFFSSPIYFYNDFLFFIVIIICSFSSFLPSFFLIICPFMPFCPEACWLLLALPHYSTPPCHLLCILQSSAVLKSSRGRLQTHLAEWGCHSVTAYVKQRVEPLVLLLLQQFIRS